MSQLFSILLIGGLIVALILAVIYEPAWKELLRSREARKRREEHERDDH
jgi:uncharacterized protein (DUF2062 family)